MKKWIIPLALLVAQSSTAQDTHRYDPPWNTPPAAGVNFTIPGIDNVPDLYGDVRDPQLIIFFAGNQFMVIDTLIREFKRSYPQYQRVFAETLPPGILARQIETGSLTMGNMRIDFLPDVYTAGKARIDEMRPRFSAVAAYAGNRIAIMARQDKAEGLKSLRDLGRPGLRVAMPNPAWEGIGRRIEEAYRKAGGDSLRNVIMDHKTVNGETWLTRIHHRESPMRMLYNEADAGPVWYTEALYQQRLGHPLVMIEIPESENIRATYMAGILKNASHPQAAKDFLAFLTGPRGQAIYRHFGFTAP